MRDITCPADLDRLPACPSCQQLQRDLAACQGRAERAEKERDYAVRSTFKARERAHCLSSDLAAARGERDRLREAMERLETVARGLEKDLRNAQLPWFAERVRAALEKTNG